MENKRKESIQLALVSYNDAVTEIKKVHGIISTLLKPADFVKYDDEQAKYLASRMEDISKDLKALVKVMKMDGDKSLLKRSTYFLNK